MKLSWFASVNMIILVGMVHIYHWAKHNYDEKDVLSFRVKALTKQLNQSYLKVTLLEDQFLGFRQEVAMALEPDLLKQKMSSPTGYSLRSLASVTQKPRGEDYEGKRTSLANIQFESARTAFQKGLYEEASRLLRSFIKNHGYSLKAPEAHFLLVESLYQEGRVEEAVEGIRRMVDLFPGHEVAGFSMIRLGKIMEGNGRASDAIEIYKTVLKTFPQREVASQAKESLAGVSY